MNSLVMPDTAALASSRTYTLVRCVLIATALIAAMGAAVLVCLYPVILFVVTGVALWKLATRDRGSMAHGSARWASPKDVDHLLDGSGLILGHLNGRVDKVHALRALFDRRRSPRAACQRFLSAFRFWSNTPVVRLTNAVHIAAFAPTGAGKGVSLVIPYLLTCPDSMVVIDFKGENARITARARRAMGHHVIVVDPYRVTTSEPGTFNPMEWIDPDSPTALDDCRDLAEMLVVRTGQEKEPHWVDSAEVWIAAMIAVVVHLGSGKDKSLQTVRTLLTDPEKMQGAIDYMCQSDAMGGMLARLGHQLTHFKDKELASTLTSTNRFLRFLDTPAIAESTGSSSFDPADLIRRKTTVYLVLPPDRVHAQAGLLRLWIGSLLRAVIKEGLQEKTKVHFILDEAAALGHMDVLDDAVDKARGYGIRLLFVFQSMGQLRKCFPEGQDQTLLSNVTQVFFGVNDQQTAEYVSARLGDATITTESGGTSRGTTTQRAPQGENTSDSSTVNSNWQYISRKLLRPEEVVALHQRVAITFTPGVPPLATRLIRYYERDFRSIDGPGPVRTAIQAACLTFIVLVVAVTVAAIVLDHAHS